jgi:predicted nucleic acid-binding protein
MTATKNEAFLDSNILLYLLSEDADKANRSEALLRAPCIISVQVLNEITHTARRKFNATWSQVETFVSAICNTCDVLPLTAETHHTAREIAERYQLGFYDALIVAAALLAKCDTLYSEDMHDGLVIEKRLRIRNPFVS